MSQWFLVKNGKECGPFHTDDILALCDRGKLHAQSRLRNAANSEFLPLPQFAEFTQISKNLPQGEEEDFPCATGTYDVLADRLRFSCPECGQHYSVDRDTRSGLVLACLNCKTVYRLQNHQNGQSAALVAATVQEEPKSFPIMGDLVCPHCWNTFSSGDVRYISCHPDLIGDPIAGPMEQKRFIPKSYNADGLPLDEKGMVCTDMACPHCHLPLPSSILDLDSKYISIVGAPSCGKSYYLTALVHQLRKALPEYANKSFADVDPRINRTISEYENRMFMASDRSKVVTLLKTEQVGKDFSDQTIMNGLPLNLPKPFIFQCDPLNRADRTGATRPLNLIFYDNAGEHFQPGNEKVSNPATLHLAHSDAIFFLLDPLNDPGMRGICDTDDPQLKDDSKVTNQTILFSEMVSRIRRHANMTMEEKSSIPLIITVGKYDAWENHFSCKLRELSPFSFHAETLENEYDADMVYRVSFALRELMLEYAPGIVAQAEAFFETVLFVPVSTFGVPASCGEEISYDGRHAVGVRPLLLAPIWVEVPFFAVLDHFGHLPRKEPTQESRVLNTRICGDKIVFAHPLSGKKVQLPIHYAGHTLDFGGEKWSIPKNGDSPASTRAAETDFWK